MSEILNVFMLYIAHVEILAQNNKTRKINMIIMNPFLQLRILIRIFSCTLH